LLIVKAVTLAFEDFSVVAQGKWKSMKFVYLDHGVLVEWLKKAHQHLMQWKSW
jgi:hypothetical protein